MATHFSVLAWRVPMDRGAWWAAVRGVAESRTRVSTHSHREENVKTSLAAQWLRLCTANAEGMISTPSQGTQTDMPQSTAKEKFQETEASSSVMSSQMP